MAKDYAERSSKSKKEDSQDDEVGSKRIHQQAKCAKASVQSRMSEQHMPRQGLHASNQSSNNRLFRWRLSAGRQGSGEGNRLPALISA
jgi:hypothetical protein